ncbi:MAG TPA: hypothetical protein VFC22_07125 [Solirubrobacteraceae bacterium]|nr:hypothetical protein [Solirubrobacteraceae bacterium]
MTTEVRSRLAALGDDLERAIGADLLSGAAAESAPPRRRRRRSRRVVFAAAALALAIPGAAIGADVLLSGADVAQSLPAGTKALIGTDPSCTVVTAGVEYHCTLASAPPAGQGIAQDTVEPTVDATKHVNGGCRAIDAAATSWECYIGQAAVTQKIIGAGFLGQYAPAPGVG